MEISIDKDLVCLTTTDYEWEVEFDRKYFFAIPKLSVKIWPGFEGAQAKYFGMTWCLTVSWLWFDFTVLQRA